MLKPIPIDDAHIQRIELRTEHKHGKHARLFVDECPECQADLDVRRMAAVHAPNPEGNPGR